MKILENKIVFEGHVKEDAKELITTILQEDPKARPSIIEIMDSAWVRKMQNEFKIKDNVVIKYSIKYLMYI